MVKHLHLGRAKGWRGKTLTKLASQITRASFKRGKSASRRKTGYYGYGTKESKFFDTTLVGAAVATGGTFHPLALVPQSLTESGRVGRMITVTQVMIKGVIEIPPSSFANLTSDLIRIVLIQDKQANGAIPAVGDYLELNEFIGFNNLTNKNRFRTLASTIVRINAGISGNGTTEQTGEALEYFSLFKKVKIPIEYDSTTGAITEISSNNIIVLIIGEEGATLLRFEARIRYTG